MRSIARIDSADRPIQSMPPKFQCPDFLSNDVGQRGGRFV